MRKMMILIISLALILCVSGCRKEEEQKKESVDYKEKLAECVSVDGIEEISGGEEASTKVRVTVTMPDIESLIDECMNEAEEKASNDNTFDKRILRSLYQNAKKSNVNVTKEFEIDPKEADPEKNEWDETDIEDIARRYAIEKEIEAYCMRIVLTAAPDIEY